VDPRSAFGTILVLLGLGGLIALALKWLRIENGTLVIGAPTTDASAPAAGSGKIDTTNTGGGAYGKPSTIDKSNTGGGTYASTTSDAAAIASVLGNVSSPEALSAFYDPSSPYKLVSAIAGDGATVNPLNPMGLSSS